MRIKLKKSVLIAGVLLLSSLPGVLYAEGPNLLPSTADQWHYGFEGGSTLNDPVWEEIGSAGSIDNTGSNVRSGNRACRLEDPIASYGSRTIYSSTVAVDMGEQYNVSVWAYVPSEAGSITDVEFKLGIRWYDSSNTFIVEDSTSGITLSAYDTFEEITFSTNVAATAAYGRLVIDVLETNPLGYVPHLDDAKFAADVADLTPPAGISSLTALTGASQGTVNIKWTAPGDDETSGGNAIEYLVKYATSPITSTNFYDDFVTTYTAASSWEPATAGTEEIGRVVSGLTLGTTYWFAVKAKDDGLNWSVWPDISIYQNGTDSINAAYAQVQTDFVAPSAISNLTALAGSYRGSVSLKWTAPGEDGSGGGAATEYLVKYATNQITSANFYDSFVTTYTPASSWVPAVAGTEESTRIITGLREFATYYFAIKTKDSNNNWSSWSSVPYSANSNMSIAKHQGPHVVISEIGMDYFDAASSGNDFVELYNPTDSDIIVTGWSVQRDAVGVGAGYVPGPSHTAILTGTIPAKGYYLIVDKDADPVLYNIADSSTTDMGPNEDDIVFLVSNSDAVTDVYDSDIIDFVGFDTCIDYEGSGATPEDITDEQSLERKSAASDTAADLASGGSSANAGNGYDSQDNSQDFVLQSSPNPQNSSNFEPDNTPPSAISNLTTLAGSAEGVVLLSWTAPGNNGASGSISGGTYKIRVSTGYINSSNFDSISTNGYYSYAVDKSTSFADAGSTHELVVTGLYPGTTYYAAIKLSDPANNTSVWLGTSSIINTVSFGFAQDLKPSPVTDLALVAGDGEILLSWTEISGFDIDFYRIYVDSTSASYDFADAYTIDVDTGNDSYTETGLTNNVTYFYKIEVWDTGDIAGDLFSVALSSAHVVTPSTFPYSGAPLSPSGFAASVLSTTSINWAWTDNSNNEDGFEIRTSTDGVIVSSTTVTVGTTFWIQTGLTANTSSYVQNVRAVNFSGYSSSSVASGLPVFTFANPPGTISFDQVYGSSVTLSWGANSNASHTRWAVSYSTVSNFSAAVTTSAALSDNLTANTTTVYSLLGETTYWFQVWAYNGDDIISEYAVSDSTITEVEVASLDVVINEIAWMGTDYQSGYEWIELFNNTGGNLDLTGWTLEDSGGVIADLSDMDPIVMNNSTVTAGGYYLIEYEKSDETASAIGNKTGDFQGLDYTSLNNTTERLRLRNASGELMDEVDCSTTTWYAGTSSPRASMERKSAVSSGNVSSNWGTALSNNGSYDFGANLIIGTPGGLNSVTPETSAPAAISNLTALAGSAEGTLLLSWTAPGNDGTSGDVYDGTYNIRVSTAQISETNFNTISTNGYYSYSVDKSTDFVDAGSTHEITITGLYPGTTYYCAVKLTDFKTNSALWPGIAVNTASFGFAQDLKPSPITDLAILAGDEQILLSWTEISGFDIDFYRIYVDSTSASYDFADAYTIDVDTGNDSYTETGLTNNVTYFYKIEVWDTGDIAGDLFSVALSSAHVVTPSTFPYAGPPFAATVFSATVLSTTSINWYWTDNSNNEDGFELRTSTDGVIASSTTITSGTTYWIQTGLSANTSSYVQNIRAVNTGGYSSSATVTGFPVFTDANAPGTISIDQVTASSVTLSWGANSNPSYTNWALSYSTVSSFSVGVTTFVSLSDSLTDAATTAYSLSGGTTYWFKVWSYNGDGILGGYTVSGATKTPVEIATLEVVINEIAWMGTEHSFGYEWVELYNNTGSAMDLTGWTLEDSAGVIADLSDLDSAIMNNSTIAANGYYLIEYEKSDETASAISDVTGDFQGLDYSGLGNVAERLRLRNASGELIDEVDCSSGWFAGDNDTKTTMEKVDPSLSGNSSSNWATATSNNGKHDESSNIINGTPRAKNSVTPDVDPPKAVTTLIASSTGTAQGIMLSWKSPSGDSLADADNTNGYYYIKYATYSINALGNDTTAWWNNISNSAGAYSGRVTASNTASIGSLEENLVSGLYPYNTYWFAIQTYDAANNSSSFDNVSYSSMTQASNFVQDIDPVKPTGLNVPSGTALTMSISWSANTEVDISTYALYRASASVNPRTSSAYAVFISTVYGATNYQDTVTDISKFYTYWIKAIDDAGNVSVFSDQDYSSPDLEAPVIIHTALNQRALGDDYIYINFDVTDNVVVKSATVTYRGIEGISKTEAVVPAAVAASLSGEIIVNKNYISSKGLEYFIETTDGLNSARLPVSGWYSLETALEKPEQKFITPSNPQVVFGREVEEVFITDVRGNKVFKKSRGGSPFIVWNPSENGEVKIESGVYIYKIKTADGDKYGPIIIAK